MRVFTLAALALGSAAGWGGAAPARTARVVVADNAATSTPSPSSGKAPDATAYPNSPNGSPATAAKGAPVATDRKDCKGPAAGCPDSPAPSGKADTSDTSKATPTTTNAR